MEDGELPPIPDVPALTVEDQSSAPDPTYQQDPTAPNAPIGHVDPVRQQAAPAPDARIDELKKLADEQGKKIEELHNMIAAMPEIISDLLRLN